MSTIVPASIAASGSSTLTHGSPVSSSPVLERKGGYRWYVLGVLVLIFAVQHLDRQIVSILFEPLKREFGLSDSQLGLLAGSCFAISYAIAGIPLGMLGDRVNRRNMLAAALAIWSVMTALSGFAKNLTHLIVARLCVGAAESSNMPLSMSMLTDLFARTERSRAFGVLWVGIALGAVLGYGVAGPVAAAWGWRAAFFIAGIPGVIIAVVLLVTTREPLRRRADDRIVDANEKAPPLMACLRFFWSQRSLVLIYAANVASAVVAAGVTSWMPSFLMRVHHLSLHDVGILLGVVFGVCTAVGALLGGFIGDAVAKRNFLWLPYVPAVSIAIVAVAGVSLVLAPSIYLVIALLAVKQIAQMTHSAPSYAVGQSLVGARMRGTANSVTLVLSNLFGFGLGPGLIGYLSDLFAPWAGAGSIRYAMLAVCFIGIVSALLFALSTRTLKQDLERAAHV